MFSVAFFFGSRHPRLTFTAELFLRAIFKYQVEVFGEHELIFLVVPKIVTTMTQDRKIFGAFKHPIISYLLCMTVLYYIIVSFLIGMLPNWPVNFQW